MTRLTNWSLLTIVSIICFASTGFAIDTNLYRIIPEGTFFVHEAGKIIGEYTVEAPFPEGKMISCEGKCAVLLDDIVFGAEDQSHFSIETQSDSRYLKVNQGTIYFGLTKMSRKFVIITPDGVVTSNNLLLNASSNNNLLEGYVKVNTKANELGVISGGAIQISSSDGRPTWVKSGERLILAQANMGKDQNPDIGTEDENVINDKKKGGYLLSDDKTVGWVVAGGIGAAAGAWYFLKNDKDNDSSPSKPKD